MKRGGVIRLGRLRWAGATLGIAGVLLTFLLLWEVFFWVPTERTMGVVQRIFYIHVPAAWVAFMAFGIVAICSAVYLWLKDERLDMAALAAAEGGILFTAICLLTGPLWGRVAWGTWWSWEPRLTLTLLLWFIYIGYFLVRASTENPERGKRFAAVVGIVGALDIPLIHISVKWFRSLHPEPVVMNPDGPTLHPDMLTTLFTGLGAFTVIFFSLFLFRYALELVRKEVVHREAAGDGHPWPEGVKP
jgi:heme exporter protein C